MALSGDWNGLQFTLWEEGQASAGSVTQILAPSAAIDWLARPPVPASESLRCWTSLARFVLSLLARRQFAPGLLAGDNGRYRAIWRPIVSDPGELAWLEQIAERIPGHPAIGERLKLVESFLSTCVDAVVRNAVAGDPFFERLHERVRGQVPQEVRWLTALLGGDPFLDGAREENAALVEQVGAWVGVLNRPAAADEVRLCFELREPEQAASRPQVESAPSREPELSSDASAEADGARPPTNPERTWCVKVDLETALQPARRFRIADVWLEPVGPQGLFNRDGGGRRERLAAELTRAEKSFPLLQGLLERDDPGQLELSVWEARMFIRQWAPALRAMGCHVSLPAWAERPTGGLGLRMFVRPRSPSPFSANFSNGVLGLDSLLDFDWRVAIGDQEVEPAEFERWAAKGTPLVRHGDAWVDWEAESADQVLEFLRRGRSGEITLGEAMRMAYGVADTDTAVPIVGLSGDAWIDALLRGVPEGQVRSLTQPHNFYGELRPYQGRGLDWLAFLNSCGIGACLADDMGLGKTVQLIALLLHERESASGARGREGEGEIGRVGEGERGSEAEEVPAIHSPTLPLSPSPLPGRPGPTLLFAPASVVGNWEREIQRFAPSLRALVHHGPQRLDGEAFQQAAAEHDVVITTYALGHRDFDELRRVTWHRVVLDEAQKIKNPAASQTAAIRSLRSPHRVALTGTPIENHLPELWSIMEALNPGLLGSAAQFRKRFVIPIEKQRDAGRAAQLRKLLQPFILRRVKSDPSVICDLPEKMEMRVYCNLTVEQAARYRQLVDDSMAEIDSSSGIRRRGLILAMLTRLKQVCDHPSLVLKDGGPLHDRSGKCERLVEMLEEVLEEGDAALVFTQYRQMGHLLEEVLAQRLGIETMFLHGGTPTKRRDQMIERFQDPEGGIKVFLLSLKAGGLGINLTAANHVFHFDRWWNPAVEAQATDRSHRVGQTRRVQVHKFVCIGTVEERIDRLLEEKRALADNIIQSGDEWLTGLSTTDLREYIMLSQEAVG